MMPEGLLNPLGEDEVLDLLAYLLSVPKKRLRPVGVAKHP